MRLIYFLLSVLLLSSFRAFPESKKNSDKTTVTVSNPTSETSILEKTDELYPEEIGSDISSQVLTLSNRLDSFFGEPRGDDEKNGSTLKVAPAIKFYAEQPTEFEMGVNLNLKLKNLEKKAAEWIKAIEEKYFPRDQVENLGLSEDNVDENQRWRITLENKIVARPAIYAGVKLRIRRNIVQDYFLHHVSFEGGWDSEYHWHQISVLHSDLQLRENILFRFVNEAALFFSDNQIITTHGPSLMQTINQYNSISYNARVYFDRFNNALEHLNSTINIDFRNGTPSKRVYVDIVPEFSYPRTNNYKEVKSIYLKLEYVFGDL